MKILVRTASLLLSIFIFEIFCENNECKGEVDEDLTSPCGQNMEKATKNRYKPKENAATHEQKDLKHFKGHLKPFGESGDRVPIKEIRGFPSDNNQNFYLDHVLPSFPVLMKGAATRSPSFHKWTDDYLLRMSSLAENRNTKVDVEIGKKERRGDGGLLMTFQEFLRVYNESDLYLVQDVLSWMEPISLMPCPLQCPEMKEVGMKRVLWLSSGGTKSTVHTDGLENINCLYRGNKTLVMMDPNKISTGTVINNLDGAFSSLDVDSVDLNRFPTLRGAQFITAFMEQGDCLYIPQYWIHQVRSFGSNLAINVWFVGRQTRDLLVKGHCTGNDLVCDPTFTLGRIRHAELSQDDKSEQDVERVLRHFFEYSTIHGKAAMSPGNPPMTKADERVKRKEFIEEFIEYYLLYDTDRTKYQNTNDDEHGFHKDDENDNNVDDDDNDNDTGDDDKDVREDDKTIKRLVEQVSAVIRQLDTNDDGVLTSLEFEEGLVDAWARISGSLKP